MAPLTRQRRSIGIAILIAVLVIAVACEHRETLTAPDTGRAAITVESATITATAPLPPVVRGPFIYRMSLTLRETGGVGATILQIQGTVTETSGAAAVTQISPTEAFGTTSIPPNGRVVSAGIALTGPLATVDEVGVRVTFLDDHGNVGSVLASTPAHLDLTGNWSGSFRTNVPVTGYVDWSVVRASLVQRDTALTGELVSRDGQRFPLLGTVMGRWAPEVTINMPGCSFYVVASTFGFENGRVHSMAGLPMGRCLSTVGGTFELQRSF